jgi:hypothetical protein
MGGCGSGRYRGPSRPVVEQALSLDVDWFRREGVLVPHCRDSSSVTWPNVGTGEKSVSIAYELQTEADVGWLRLTYPIMSRATDELQELDYRVKLVTTRPHFGDVRWWFLCPLTWQRVRMLYLHPFYDRFASRQALGLTHASYWESRKDRAKRRVQKILRQLGGTGALAELGRLPKPKGMHWETFDRLSAAAQEAYIRFLRESGAYGLTWMPAAVRERVMEGRRSSAARTDAALSAPVQNRTIR